MKRSILLPVTLLFAMTINAQFKVHSSGQVSIVTTALPSNNAKLTVGDTTNIASNENVNTLSCMYVVPNKTNVAVNGIVQTSNNSSGRAIGVRGQGRGGGYGLCFGVLGNLNSSDYGAGIIGGIDCPQGIAVSGKYAGYFYGSVYSTSYMTAQSFNTLSDRNLKENITPFGQSDEESTLSHVEKMNVVEYTYKDFKEENGEACIPVVEPAEEKKLHYGLIAQELQEIYPELVNKEQNGYLSINYVEMVPVLIRSIQELKKELDELRNNKREAEMSRSAIGHFDEDETTNIEHTANISATATLAQNTPNPFTERTTIRFTLPDDSQEAYICIFDMSGKMIKQIPVSAAMQSVTINGHELRAGMYIYSLIVGGKEIQTKRMILTK